MSRKEELEQIIEAANAELKVFKQREAEDRWVREALREIKEGYQLSKEELLVIVDEVYSQETLVEVMKKRLTDFQ